METPKILSVVASPPTILMVEFEGNQWRRYDMAPLMKLPAFEPLHNAALFRSVYADRGGYGVIWNDDIDLAEHELWRNGTPMAAPDSTPGMLFAAEPDKT
jgi:hypothetical protein